MPSGGIPSHPDRRRAWLELDFDAQPIEGTLAPPGGPTTPFVGWLGLTVALDGLRPAATADHEDGPPEKFVEGSTTRSREDPA